MANNLSKTADIRRTMIMFKNVDKVYPNGQKAIDNFNIRIYSGDFVFLMGPSGAGKSTFIKLLMKEEEPTSGRILVNERDLARVHKGSVQRYRRNISVVFQDYRLLENKTVFGNVAFAMEIMGASRAQIRDKVKMALQIMGLENKAGEYPRNLSGGEQQRVALARAIVNNPRILIADEPTGNLDPENAWEIMKLFARINEHGTTVLIATHAKELVDRMKNVRRGMKIIFFDHGVIDEKKSLGLIGRTPAETVTAAPDTESGTLFTRTGALAAEDSAEGEAEEK